MKLQQLIERYIAYRQSLGEKFKTNATYLRAFGRFIGSGATVSGVQPKKVAAFWPGMDPSPARGTSNTVPCSIFIATL